MEPDDVKALSELITNVRLDLKGLDVKMDGIKDLARKVDEIQQVANRALQTADAGHKRSDDHKTRIDDMQRHYDNELRAVNIRIETEVKSINSKAASDFKELEKLIDTEIEEIHKDQIELNKEKKADRKWLVGTIIVVVVAIVANVTKYI